VGALGRELPDRDEHLAPRDLERVTNVAVDVRMASHGGIGVYVQEVLPRVVRARPQWSFTLLGDPDAATAFGWDKLPNARLKRCRAPYYSIAEQVELPLRCLNGTDVYWTPHYNIPVLMRHPTVVVVHDVCHLALPEITGGWAKQTYARFMFSRVAKTAAGIIFDSEFSRAEMARFSTTRGRTAVGPLAVDESWFNVRARHPNPPTGGPYLVYVGNWKRHKNVPTLLRAFKRVLHRIPHRLVLVGQREGLNSDGEIAREVASLGDRVLHVGEMKHADVQPWVAHADALVTTSLYEGFGLPPVEAMAAGVPCMVSNAGSIPEVCGEAALYCDPRDEGDVAARIVEIATDQALRRRLIELGRPRARNFTWERCAAATLEMLDHAAA
jgi:glycosyltransferase involved in cell wall biosynthesis